MASGFSTATRNSVLDDLFYTPTVYGALCTADPGDAGSLSTTEVAALYSYARTAITFGTAAASGSISNSADLLFPAASGGSWGTITYFAICSGATQGIDDMKASGALTTSKTINDGDQLKFTSGNITITIAAQA